MESSEIKKNNLNFLTKKVLELREALCIYYTCLIFFRAVWMKYINNPKFLNDIYVIEYMLDLKFLVSEDDIYLFDPKKSNIIYNENNKSYKYINDIDDIFSIINIPLKIYDSDIIEDKYIKNIYIFFNFVKKYLHNFDRKCIKIPRYKDIDQSKKEKMKKVKILMIDILNFLDQIYEYKIVQDLISS